MFTAPTVTVRRAVDADRHVLERLAALDSSRPPEGDVLIALVGDEPQAAVAIATGEVVADPFRPTADLVELLQVRAARLAPGRPERRGLMRVLRAAHRLA